MLKFAEMCVNLHPNLNEIDLMRQIKTICFLLSTLAMMASCLSSSNSEATLYSDAAITTFSLGTLDRYLHTTSKSGGDSIYKTTLTGSNYRFHIDQVTHEIYNTDSLPIGTDLEHVLVSLTSKNNGAVLIQDTADANMLTYYSSSDSIDFTKPRTFRVYASDGTGSTEYKVSVNKHQEDGDAFVWHLLSDSWAPTPAEPQTLPAGIKQLIGGNDSEQYALSDDNRLMVSYDQGATWENDLLDEDAALLPTSDIAYVCYPMTLVSNTVYALMAGRRQAEDSGAYAKVWRKIVDYDGYAPKGSWAYIENNGSLALPAMENLTLLRYDDSVLAFGKPYEKIYQSRDNGITWKQNGSFQMPEGFDRNATSVTAVVDDDQNIWLYCEGTGQVWRGRLNRLGWAVQ